MWLMNLILAVFSPSSVPPWHFFAFLRKKEGKLACFIVGIQS
jgi:hypothetical protein